MWWWWVSGCGSCGVGGYKRKNKKDGKIEVEGGVQENNNGPGGGGPEKKVYISCGLADRPTHRMKVEVRERRARLAKAQARKAFAKSMERAEEVALEMSWAEQVDEEKPAWPAELGAKFVEWGEAYYKWLKENTHMSKAHLEMRYTWNEIKATAAACAKATEARLGRKRKERQMKARG